jgi:CDP-diglyceride synthetase
MSEQALQLKWLRLLLLLPLGWLAVFIFYVLPWLHRLPRSRPEWLLLFVLGPPAVVVLQLSFRWVFSARHGYAVSRHTFSLKRLLILLVAMLALSGLFYILSCAFT